MSTGGRPILGWISTRGNRYLRVVFVQAARVCLVEARELGTAREAAVLCVEQAAGGWYANVSNGPSAQ